ncbi:MAG: cytochrome c3 family protein [Dehalococcoidales bacterium]
MRTGKKGRAKWLAIGALVVLATIGAIFIVGCAGLTGPTGPAGADGVNAAATCNDCHNDTTLVYSKSFQSAQTVHQTGTAWSYAGGRAGCTACHSSEGFQEMVATGIGIEDFEEATPNPSPQNCRTCHEIHTTYTKADFALSTTSPVDLIAFDATYDRGKGNLCATCHQPRRAGPEEGAGDYEITSTHWGPHHGPQSMVLLGIGGYGVADSQSVHYSMVTEGCPTCHMPEESHLLAPTTAACQSCHADLDTLDRNGVQTEIKALFEELGELLEGKSLHDGHPNPGTYSEEVAGAAWNYMIVYEDASWGVHNPPWTKAILEESIAALK